MRQYRLLLSCLLTISVLGCFTSNSQADCYWKQVGAHPGQTVVFPTYTTPGLNGPGKTALCVSPHLKPCLCHAKCCNSPVFILDWVLVSSSCGPLG